MTSLNSSASVRSIFFPIVAFFAGFSPCAFANIVTTNSSTATVIQTSSTSSGASSIAVAGTSFTPSFATLDFSTAALGFTVSTRAASINAMSLSLTDLNTNPGLASGIVDVYISNNTTTPPASLSYQTAAAPQGVGAQLNSLTEVANIDLSSTAGEGTSFNPNFTLDAPTQAYILNQINLGAPIRVVLAADAANVSALFEGSNGNLTNTPPLPAPSLKINLNPAGRVPGDANGDNIVDIRDLQVLANHWQQNITGAAYADFNDSGTVDIIDLQALANNWQFGVSGSGSGSSDFESLGAPISPAPECATLLVFAFTAPLILRRQGAHQLRHIVR